MDHSASEQCTEKLVVFPKESLKRAPDPMHNAH